MQETRLETAAGCKLTSAAGNVWQKPEMDKEDEEREKEEDKEKKRRRRRMLKSD